MILEILISTINERIYQINKIIPEPMKNVKYFVSHQITNYNKDFTFDFKRKDIRYDKIYNKGLSNNRNNCLIHATGDICLISDDDVLYKKSYLRNIINIFSNYPSADIITFKAKTLIKNSNSYTPYRKYPIHPFWHNFLTLNVSSIEIAFKRNIIEKANLRFDKIFGLGSIFPRNEENIFLHDALKKRLNILFYPCYVVSHPYNPKKNICYNFIKKKLIETGAINYRNFGIFSIIINFISELKAFKQWNKKVNLYEIIIFTTKGSIECFKLINQEKFVSLDNQIRILKYIINQINIILKRKLRYGFK